MIMKNGINGAVMRKMMPESRSMGKTNTRMEMGTRAVMTSCGRYWLK
jgi:hypothetical protein